MRISNGIPAKTVVGKAFHIERTKSCVRLLILLLLIIFFIDTGSFASQDSARPSADWVKNAIIYEVFVRDFGPQGTFKEVEAKLPELKQLGATVLWLMPIHPIGKVKRLGTWGNSYAIQDYLKITPDYGTEDDLRSLVQSAHRYKMNVILDMVADHTAWDHSWITTHPDYYHRDSTGTILSPDPHWKGVAWLDYSNPALRKEMATIMKYWIEKCDIDGYRCDYAIGVPTDFWESIRPELEKIKPEILMLAESHVPELQRKAFDLSYSWPLYDVLRKSLAGTQPAHAIVSTILQERKNFPQGALLLRFIDNHDKERAPVAFGEEKWKPAAAVAFLVPGVPLLYNGQEIGDTTVSHFPYLFEKNPIQWQTAGTARGQAYWNFYKTLIELRQNHPSLRSDNISFLPNDQDNSVVTFLRWDQNQTVLVAVNLSGGARQVSIDLRGSPIEKNRLLKNLLNTEQSITLTQPIVEITLLPYAYAVWLVR
jgi:glycosidase